MINRLIFCRFSFRRLTIRRLTIHRLTIRRLTLRRLILSRMPSTDPGVQLLNPPPPDCAEVLSPAALQFLAALARRFEPQRQELLERRRARQAELDAGRLPDFLPDTRDVREREWIVAPLRPDLIDRRVEITGPVDRKMMINALNSGANV